MTAVASPGPDKVQPVDPGHLSHGSTRGSHQTQEVLAAPLLYVCSSGKKTEANALLTPTDLDVFPSLFKLVILKKGERKPLVTSGFIHTHTHKFSVKPNHCQHPA